MSIFSFVPFREHSDINVCPSRAVYLPNTFVHTLSKQVRCVFENKIRSQGMHLHCIHIVQTYDISLDSPWVEQNQTSFNVDTKRSRLQNCILLQVKLKCEGMIFT